MKILICCDLPWVQPRFGASRVTLDFAEALDALGVRYDFYPEPDNGLSREAYSETLGQVLKQWAFEYDVVEYPYHAAPWIEAAGEARRVLKVARIVLLDQHKGALTIPAGPLGRRPRVAALLKRLTGRLKLQQQQYLRSRAAMDANLRQADLLNVGNSRDRDRLIALGHEPSRTLVQPYGLTTRAFRRFEGARAASADPRRPVIAFVGTFDYRKGCLDFPPLAQKILRRSPEASFRILGSKGMFQTRESVLNHFPRSVQKRVEVVPEFEPADLPDHLVDCMAGVFPSYWEGFGIAVVEMLAAGLPVAAYDAPGPCDILPPDWLVRPGDVEGLAEKLVGFLHAEEAEKQANEERAIKRSEYFHWTRIAKETLLVYEAGLARLRG